MGRWLLSRLMTEQDGSSRDLARLVVPAVGSLVATEDPWEPYRLLDADGAVVDPVASYFRDLQASGRSTATLRSYGMDLLRWFRFTWAAGVPWSQATRVEAGVILSPASGRGSDLRGCVEVTVLDAAAAVFRFLA